MRYFEFTHPAGRAFGSVKIFADSEEQAREMAGNWGTDPEYFYRPSKRPAWLDDAVVVESVEHWLPEGATDG